MRPALIFPPGDLLKDELEARGWTQSDLAAILGRPEQMVSEVIRGKKQITPETSIELGQALGTSPEFWYRLETTYQQRLAERRREADSGISRRARVFDLLPIRQMRRLGWVDLPSSADQLEMEVLRFLGLTSFELPGHLAASFRCGRTSEPSRFAQLAWLRRLEQVAKQAEAAQYSSAALLDAMPDLLALSRFAEDVARVGGLLADVGVRFVILPHLERTYVDGAAIWLDGQPVVALTLRYDRIDAFWFTMLHELAHILAASDSGHAGPVVEQLYDEPRNGIVVPAGPSQADDEEAVANAAAANWLIPPEQLHQFVARTAPYFSGAKVRAFAESISRHPGIVLGRLHKDGWVPYSNLRALLPKVSPYLGDMQIAV